MSKRVYLVTMHTGNSLTVHSQKFVRGRTVVVEDENLVNYLSGHPNFTIVPKSIADDTPVVTETPPATATNEGGVNTSEDLELGLSPRTPVTNVAKAPAPVKRPGRASADSAAK